MHYIWGLERELVLSPSCRLPFEPRSAVDRGFDPPWSGWKWDRPICEKQTSENGDLAAPCANGASGDALDWWVAPVAVAEQVGTTRTRTHGGNCPRRC